VSPDRATGLAFLESSCYFVHRVVGNCLFRKSKNRSLEAVGIPAAEGMVWQDDSDHVSFIFDIIAVQLSGQEFDQFSCNQTATVMTASLVACPAALTQSPRCLGNSSRPHVTRACLRKWALSQHSGGRTATRLCTSGHRIAMASPINSTHIHKKMLWPLAVVRTTFYPGMSSHCQSRGVEAAFWRHSGCSSSDPSKLGRAFRAKQRNVGS
jgi:hypothetical protein